MNDSEERQLFFDPVTAELRFDHNYNYPFDIPSTINWPLENQRNNLKYGFKNLTLALTMKCNLACTYCWQSNRDVPDMEKKTIDKWLEFFLDKKVNTPNKILYYGGEPLLRMDLIEYSSLKMRSICEERGIRPVKQHIFTNATLLNDNNLDLIQKENIFLILSMDGDQTINSKYRHNAKRQSLFEQIIDGVERLQLRGIPFGVCCTLSEIEFDLNRTVKYIIDYIKPASVELNIRHDLPFSIKAREYEGKYLHSFCEAWDLIRNAHILNIDLRKRVMAILNRTPLQNDSSGSKNKLSIMPDGMVSPFNGAVSYPELQVKPEGAWIEKFKEKWNRNILVKDKCKKCRAAFICGQGSAFSSYLQNDDFNHAPVLHCEYCNTMLNYIVDIVRREMFQSREIPYGYVVTKNDIQEVFSGITKEY